MTNMDSFCPFNNGAIKIILVAERWPKERRYLTQLPVITTKKSAILVLVLPRIPPPFFGPAVDDMLFADLANCVCQMHDTP